MEDRVPTPGQDGRVLITPENGSAPFYAKITMADNPTNNGTPLTKETLLQDGTEVQIFGNADNRTVDQAFSGVMDRINLIMQNVANITLTVADTEGKPLEGVYVNGIFDENGDPVQTNASGQAIGYVAEGNQTISVSGYADIQNTSMQIDIIKGNTYMETLAVTTRNFLKVTNSRTVKFSGNVAQVDASVVGGGAGAGGSVFSSSNGEGATGGAGSGGEVINQENIDFAQNTNYPITIGAGGSPGSTDFDEASAGSPGGSTSFMNITARGGNPGTAAVIQRVSASQHVIPGNGGIGYGSGNGANGVWGDFSGASDAHAENGLPGQDGTQAYKSFTETEPLGAGGGSGAALYAGDGGMGGQIGGGNGGLGAKLSNHDDIDGTPGTDGTGSGGGSGSSSDNRTAQYVGKSARGGSGCVAIRMHLKSAA